MLLGIKWYQFVRNDDVRRLTKQPKLSAVIQSHRFTLFGHIMRMDDNADAKRILLASPPADWGRQLCRPRIMWLSTVQQDLKQQHLMLPKQQIWLRTALCGGWCRRMALRNRELHARNDDDDQLRTTASFLSKHILYLSSTSFYVICYMSPGSTTSTSWSTSEQV